MSLTLNMDRGEMSFDGDDQEIRIQRTEEDILETNRKQVENEIGIQKNVVSHDYSSRSKRPGRRL